jgi:hypothetical protein
VAATSINHVSGLAIATVAILGLGVQGELVFRYILSDGLLSIKLFGHLSVRRIELKRVKEISTVRLSDWIPFSASARARYLWCERWGGWMLFFRGIAITLESGKTILIAPRHRETFMNSMNAELVKTKSNHSNASTQVSCPTTS